MRVAQTAAHVLFALALSVGVAAPHAWAQSTGGGAAEAGAETASEPAAVTDTSADDAEAASDDAEAEDANEALDPFEWFALPLAGFSSDIGLAGILLGVFVWHEEGHEPYRDRLQIVSSATTKKVIYDEIRYERVGLFGLPLRLSLTGRFVATSVSNYCGLGNDVSCDPAVARAAADAAGLTPGTPDYNQFVRRYYRFRATRPELHVDLRYVPRPGGIEFRFGWRLGYEIAGFFRQRGVYAGSLYAQDYPGGEEGLRSEAQVGAMLDRRDDERRPSSGYLLDVSLRGAAFVVGSAWNYAGLTLGGAYYLSFDRRHRYVLASRLVGDLLVGDAPTVVLGSVGGFWSELAYGGQYMGRGIRARRYIGRLKLIGQTELRLVLIGPDDGFRVLVQAFADAGYIGVSLRHFGGDAANVLLGFGGGVAAYWGRSFILRFDVGTSALEHYHPSFYLTLSHPY